MATDQETTTAAAQWWGTLEELLLACAVNRHGTKSWDSIAMEVQTRSSTLSFLTPQTCKDKFHDLRRRFGFTPTSQSDAELGTGFLVDQLRRIRVQELRDEVQRRDVSIVSLEMKVKRLEEDRERNGKADADLDRETKASPEIFAGKSSAVEANSDERDNRSFNESNSTTQKAEMTTNKKQNDTVLVAEENEPIVKPEPEAETEPVSGEPDRDRNWSSNGKLNGTGIVKDDDENDKTTSDGKTGSESKNKTSGAGGLSESNELWDESKGEGRVAAASKQSSDVQSSASLSKTVQRRSCVGGAAGCSSSEEVSPATKKVLAVKSEPLVRLLGMIRSHRLGSHFERRLRSQESERYKRLVRQHIDVRTIESRLNRGLYSNCFQRFYRDLLLLFNNFVIFFRKTSQEHAAAQQLRALVIKEMTDKLQKPEPEPEPELPPVSQSKPNRSSTIMVVCGTRRSENARKRGGDKKEREVEEKPKVVNEKKFDGNPLLGIEDKGVKKKSSNERSVSGRRNSRSSSSNININNNNRGGGEAKHLYGNNELSSHDGVDAKLDKKKEISARKKQGAASFLRRMKQNSPKKVAVKEEEEDDDDNDSDDDESKDSRVEEHERKDRRGRNNNSNKNNNSNNKRDVRRERVTRSSSNLKGRGGERDESGRSGRKAVGRPTKRPAAKRGRENGESEVGEVVGGGKSARKRTRR
ncbi:hypothetical protein Ddye_023120 [Dipteronia dyeriana]|uniref:Bromo domain-containing protein n=1 Tax=Dipteronia dyeriana TaxID=168575 RepID=A0AAD9WT13_9ROSI|nr:hypothetical protein Ddye_023120 [Dipteronia dyeriana]